MTGPFTSRFLRREELEEKLEKIVETLKQKGILPQDVDTASLVHKAAAAMGDVPKEMLNDPAVQLKMTIALVATYNKKDMDEIPDLEWLINKDKATPEQQEKEILKVIEEFREKNEEGAKKLDEMVDAVLEGIDKLFPEAEMDYIADDAGVKQVDLIGEVKPAGVQAHKVFSLVFSTAAEFLPKVLEDEAFPERFHSAQPRPSPYNK